MTSPPTFKSDDKRPITVKAPVKSSVMGTSSSTITSNKQPSKRIDLGAASNYGKTTELGINSPTHRNTHSEDLFGTEISSTSNIGGVLKDNNDIFDADDFDPRAGEAATGDFGDFESAFGAVAVAPAAKIPLPSLSSSQSAGPSTNFADFSSAFSSSIPVQSKPLDDDFLFASQTNSTGNPTSTNNPLSTDLFGNNVITSAFASPPIASSSTGKNDLLDDFTDLRINQSSNQGEYLCIK